MNVKIATLALMLCSGVASANISVNGNGKITYVPNMGYVSTTVSSDGKTAQQAWQANAELVKKLVKTLQDNGIDLKDAKTAGLNLTPQYIYPPHSKPELVGYTATYTLSITVRKLNDLGKILDELVAGGANRNMSIQFTHDKLDDLIDQARVKAVADARRKAELFAKGAGAQLGGLVRIDESAPYYAHRFHYEHAPAKSAAGHLPILAGQQETSVTISVVFALKKN